MLLCFEFVGLGALPQVGERVQRIANARHRQHVKLWRDPSPPLGRVHERSRNCVERSLGSQFLLSLQLHQHRLCTSQTRWREGYSHAVANRHLRDELLVEWSGEFEQRAAALGEYQQRQQRKYG